MTSEKGRSSVHRPWEYPILGRRMTPWESCAHTLRRTVGYCLVCRRLAVFRRWTDNFRDSGFCSNCGSFCRQRQVALIIKHAYRRDPRYVSLSDNELVIVNTEARGGLHGQLIASSRSQYTATEYFGPDVPLPVNTSTARVTKMCSICRSHLRPSILLFRPTSGNTCLDRIRRTPRFYVF